MRTDAIQEEVDRAVEEANGRATRSVDEAAELLGVSRATAYAAVHSGEIPSIKIGSRLLIPAAALDRMLDGSPAAG